MYAGPAEAENVPFLCCIIEGVLEFIFYKVIGLKMRKNQLDYETTGDLGRWLLGLWLGEIAPPDVKFL